MAGAFIPLAFFDTLELAGSLRTRWGGFKPEQPGHRILRIRGNVKDSDPAEDRFARYAVAKDWPELTAALDEITGKAEAMFPPGVDLGLVALEMLDVGAAVAWRGETAEYFTRWSRAILPVRTSPGVVLLAGHETLIPAHGMLTVVSPRMPRAALNMGEHACVWLAIDFKRRSAAKDH